MQNKTLPLFTLSATVIALFTAPSSVLAQSPYQVPAQAPMYNPMMASPSMQHNPMHHQGGMMPAMPQDHPMDFQGMSGNQSFPEFPTPEQLANMVPPEPMTEEKIKDRFSKRKAMLSASLERDRKSAEKYAQDFARYQKHQAETLASIMKKAEERRQQMLKNLEQQEKHALAKYAEFQQKPDQPSAPIAVEEQKK